MAELLALLVLIASVVVGVWLITAGHAVIGVAVFFGSIAFAIVTWMLVSDRRY